jgi:hypothetical protein
MTTDQLERELRTLAEPRDTDEDVRHATRARLSEQILVRPKRRSRTRLAVGWAAVAAAAVAIAVVSVGGPWGSAGPSAANAAILHHALRAMALPANAIVHVKESGLQDGTPVAVEWWQQTSSPHALRMIKGFGGQEVEGGNNGTTSFRYDAATDTIIETPATSAPALVDPIETVRAQLASGDARVGGTAMIDGTTFYKIELPTGVVGYFDTADYRPVYLDNPQGDSSVVRTRVMAYEELPMNPDTVKLLSLTAQHPQARVETRTAPSK